MAQSQKRVLYGIHSITPYNPNTNLPYGILETLGAGQFSITQELTELRGGSLKVPWAVEAANQSAELTLTMREYPDFIFELFMGKAPTAATTSATGSVESFDNVNGTTVKSSSNGIASVGITSGKNADLKCGLYVIKTTATQAFDVYVSTNIDFTRGENVAYENDLCKVTASPLSIAGATVDLADMGITFTAAGTPNFTVGDTASFRVLPPNAGSMSVIIGNVSDTAPEFGAILMTQKRGNQELFEIDVFKCQGGGMSIGANEKAFSETPITAKAFYDSVKGGVAKITAVRPS